MGDRFYTQMLQATGSCPGSKTKNKRRTNKMWTDELREQVIADYQAADPTPENSMEIVKEIAERVGQTPNGVRMVLSKAEVYVKKADSAAKPAATGDKKESKGRVSKEDSQQALIAALEGIDAEVNEEIITKLTGKAAIYFTSVINGLSK